MHFTVCKLHLSLKKTKGLENSRGNEWAAVLSVVEKSSELNAKTVHTVFGREQKHQLL